ncbi:discoidin domain-containing protein [Sphingobacterium tabacisoli]|uniref:Discoidin domain-containing protein n=1 Tax=Sphingobacterium tabacisoli TaxID=2044855 RepID=A0ABW5L9C6_9SPHI|nr:discoidin domain-containing protein [Sphingobacterium tabacisoli]
MKANFIYSLVVTSLLIIGCHKDSDSSKLPEGQVGIKNPAGKDTIEMPLSILKDSAIVLNFNAELSGKSSYDHLVKFSIDTNQMTNYRARYGKAEVLPHTSYLFLKQFASLPAGASVSEAATLNIGLQTKLTEYTTYVLPVVVESLDGNPDVIDKRVLYHVFKTGRPLFIKKEGWTLVNFSTQGSALPATNVLDASLTTYWGSGFAMKMPQWVTINFNKDIIFSAVNYSFPANMRYPTRGGYPTLIKIETSMDGTTWVDKGNFTGNLVENSQVLNIGLTTARYMRFTVLEAAKFVGTTDIVYISDIMLMP